MKIKLCDNVFIRHLDDETLLFHPRSGACSVLSNAREYIDPLSHEWQDVSHLISAVAHKFAISPSEIKEDAKSIYIELLSQGFATSDLEYSYADSIKSTISVAKPTKTDDDMPLSDFYKRHGGMPSELHIDLTDACTERCVHCYVPEGRCHYIKYELAKNIIEEFRQMGGMSVHLTGGEAMMHPDFKRICRLCKDLNINLIIFSNLTLCDGKMIEFMKAIDPQFINVSLYAMTPSVHDGITKLKGSWIRTMEAIKNSAKAGVHIRIATPLLKENKDEFNALRNFAKEHKMHLIASFDIVPRSDHDCSNICHACSTRELREVLTHNKELFDEGFGCGRRSIDSKICSIGTNRIYVNSEGNYYPCDAMHDYALGNAEAHSLKEIWHSARMNELRGLKEADYPKCHACNLRMFCKVCPAYNFNATGNVLGICADKCATAKVVHEVYREKTC